MRWVRRIDKHDYRATTVANGGRLKNQQPALTSQLNTPKETKVISMDETTCCRRVDDREMFVMRCIAAVAAKD